MHTTGLEWRTITIMLKLLKPNLLLHLHRNYSAATAPLPKYVNWAKEGALTEVRDQGNSLSCWAFAAVSCVEALNKIATGSSVALSEQELIDNAWQSRCGRSCPEKAFEYIIRNRGLASNHDYPITRAHGTCRETQVKYGCIDGYAWVRRNDELALKRAVARRPVSVFIDSSCFSFKTYTGGIYKTPSITKNRDHFVNVVGYGTTKAGEEFFWIRNSWGVDWGIGGYMKYKMNLKIPDHCSSIAEQASYPIKLGYDPPSCLPGQILNLLPCRCEVCAPHLYR